MKTVKKLLLYMDVHVSMVKRLLLKHLSNDIQGLIRVHYKAQWPSCKSKAFDEVWKELTQERIKALVDDYLSLSFSEEGKLTALALSVDGHTLNIHKLFIMKIGEKKKNVSKLWLISVHHHYQSISKVVESWKTWFSNLIKEECCN